MLGSTNLGELGINAILDQSNARRHANSVLTTFATKVLFLCKSIAILNTTALTSLK